MALARKNAYVAHINQTQLEWDHNNAARARELLENPDETEFRGFEWHYLKRLYYPERLSLEAQRQGSRAWRSAPMASGSPPGKRGHHTLKRMGRRFGTGDDVSTLKQGTTT